MKNTPQIQADMISNLTQMDVTCSYDEGEDMYLLRVFMVPSDQRKALKRKIYEQIDSFCQNHHIDMFYSVQLYTEQETADYYPERLSVTSPDHQGMASIMKTASLPIDKNNKCQPRRRLMPVSMTISTQSLSELIHSKFGYPTSCSYNAGEDMYLLHVFMVPSDKKNEIEDKIYDISDDLNIFMVIFVITEQETRKYYPDKVPQTSTASQMILSPAAQ